MAPGVPSARSAYHKTRHVSKGSAAKDWSGAHRLSAQWVYVGSTAALEMTSESLRVVRGSVSACMIDRKEVFYSEKNMMSADGVYWTPIPTARSSSSSPAWFRGENIVIKPLSTWMNRWAVGGMTAGGRTSAGLVVDGRYPVLGPKR